jgi:DNA-binding beta-propeller fold protein YncE
VVAEARNRLDVRDPRSMRLRHALRVPCRGVDHMDFTADGRQLLASCEFSGQLLWVDVARERVLRVLDLRPGAMPQDVKLAPDGRRFYVADMAKNGVWVVDGARDRGSSGSCRPAGAHTAWTPAATPATCTSPTGAKGPSR